MTTKGLPLEAVLPPIQLCLHLSCYDFISVFPSESASSDHVCDPDPDPDTVWSRPDRSRLTIPDRTRSHSSYFTWIHFICILYFVSSLWWSCSRFSRSCRECLRQLLPF